MIISKAEFAEYINDFRLKELFLNLGWDNEKTPLPPVQIGDVFLTPRVVADKNGFKIVECKTAVIPSYAIRIQVANILKRLFHEHLLIFYDNAKKEQVWLYCYTLNQQKKKAELRFNIGQNVERLYQRASGLIFELDEQDNITIVDVTARVRNNFAANAERVTRRFYDAFKRQHTALLGFIKGIKSTVDKEWYASIMLNRLMFCYFMQRRGFLNKDRNYLRNKLNESKKRLGKGKFYSFYRSFLLVLFQKGFGAYDHTPEIREMIGDIPYLNGGLFDLHEIERNYPDIDISDEAFENIFNLFDQYEWHLDTRDFATSNEINPDVLGYIFEKYINDRSSMGAYYTQEDITGYISRSTILPWLLESTKKSCPKAFEATGVVWSFLKNSGGTYIFDSVKHGANLSLPEHIAIGLNTDKPELLKRRERWNEPAPAEYGLPTEIWREVVERRTHCEKVKGLISSGGITDTADLITYNLDIISFVADLLDTIEDPKFIQAFYASLEQITVLDPTCGSGAFLFAALNILEPLYDSCLSRMDDYLNHDYKGIMDRNIRRFFDEKLELMENDIHPSKHYFIYKSIILNNLYGVDIMREAVETAKLRLFLKLVSTVDPDYDCENIGIEPLPDIDFNIKAGNTLIGYANEKEVDDALRKNLFSMQMSGETKDAMLQMAKATARYKQLQLGAGDYRSDDFRKAKEDLSSRQANLKKTLDSLMHKWDYGNVSDTDWATNYSPFHWVCEFYDIVVGNGGFDVIIGNPPYLEARQINYSIYNFDTIESNAVHAFCIERSFRISNDYACVSMIVPLSLVSTQRMKQVRNIIEKGKRTFYSNYSWRPGKLFDTVNRALTIFIALPNQQQQFCTRYMKWNSENRSKLFSTIFYTKSNNSFSNTAYWIGKIGSELDNSILDKMRLSNKRVSNLLKRIGKPVFYKTTGGLYWKVFTNFAPKFFANGVKGHSSRETAIYVDDENTAIKSVALLSSSTYWLWYSLSSNLRDLNPSDIGNFYLPPNWSEINELNSIGKEYIQSLISKSTMLERNQRTVGVTLVQSFKISASKDIIDRIDKILARHYGFTEEELDYIINYDIKYRMGIGGGDDDEKE